MKPLAITFSLCLAVGIAGNTVPAANDSLKASLVLASSAGEFIVLEQSDNEILQWRIVNAAGKSTNKGSVKVESKDFLRNLFKKVEGARVSSLDQNGGMPAGKYHLIRFDQGRVKILPLSLPRQEALVMDDCFEGIRALPYMDGRGGGSGAFYPMLKRFVAPMRVVDPRLLDRVGSEDTKQ